MTPALANQLLVSNFRLPAELPDKYKDFCKGLLGFLPEDRIFTDKLRCLAYGTDASFYRMVPKVVVKVADEDEVSSLLRLAYQLEIPVTFRAAGTSLSGQAITDSVLVLLAGNWTGARVESNGERIALEPGVIGSRANDILKPFKRKIGPDPASINSAMIGGIAANNASGMCCGVDFNSYRTLHSMRVILADGHLLDTDDPQSCERFRRNHRELLDSLASLAYQVCRNTELSDRIKHKYQIKNTTGYSLNALVDYHDPLEILQHLMIGSEGTLGFISEITYRTIPDSAHKGTALVLFPDIVSACSVVTELKKQKIDAVELFDRSSLNAIEDQPTAPKHLKGLHEDACALLIETGDQRANLRDAKISKIIKLLSTKKVLMKPEFTSDSSEAAGLWKLRKGLFPSVGNLRKAGTTVIIEDFAVPAMRLAEAVVDLRDLFDKYHYEDAILFGHALEGNLHFCFTQDFSTQAEVDRYENLMAEVCELLVEKYDGSLKAEHGTGRNMAPYVELEWGKEAYGLMKQIKHLFDPANLLNPGVILNNDPKIHVKQLKPLPVANEIIDKCIECGFCEVQCPSRDLSLSPRQRITAWREITRLTTTRENRELESELRKLYHYDGEDTCATDGLCAMNCPVDIDTGKLIKQLRFDQHSSLENSIANWCENNFALASKLARLGLAAANISHKVLGSDILVGLSRIIRKVSGNQIPQWNPYFPKPAPRIDWQHEAKTNLSKVVYFPSCICRMMGPSEGSHTSHAEAVHQVLNRAGYQYIHPEGIEGLCCGVAFDSKGFPNQANRKTEELKEALLKASNNGKYPILCETSPCVQRLNHELSELPVYDPVSFAGEFLLDRLEFQQLEETVVIHPTCSNRKAGHVAKMLDIAGKCAKEVVLPHTVTCCGTAGDRGIFHPELPEKALNSLKGQIPKNCSLGISNSRTCELGLSMVSDVKFESLFHLLLMATKPKN